MQHLRIPLIEIGRNGNRTKRKRPASALACVALPQNSVAMDNTMRSGIPKWRTTVEAKVNAIGKP